MFYNDICDRLIGRYPVGPVTDGEPEFGWRQFDNIPAIQIEAADEIKRLRRIESLARELITKGLKLTSSNGPLLAVVEKSDKTDPHYRLCIELGL